jgi:hypothetical protein
MTRSVYFVGFSDQTSVAVDQDLPAPLLTLCFANLPRNDIMDILSRHPTIDTIGCTHRQADLVLSGMPRKAINIKG